jgi:hypothetical protein
MLPKQCRLPVINFHPVAPPPPPSARLNILTCPLHTSGCPDPNPQRVQNQVGGGQEGHQQRRLLRGLPEGAEPIKKIVGIGGDYMEKVRKYSTSSHTITKNAFKYLCFALSLKVPT